MEEPDYPNAAVRSLLEAFDHAQAYDALSYYGQREITTRAFDLDYGLEKCRAEGNDFFYFQARPPDEIAEAQSDVKGWSIYSQSVFYAIKGLNAVQYAIEEKSLRRAYCAISILEHIGEGTHAVALAVDARQKEIIYIDPRGYYLPAQLREALHKVFPTYQWQVDQSDQQEGDFDCGIITAMNVIDCANGKPFDPNIDARLWDARKRHAPHFLEYERQLLDREIMEKPETAAQNKEALQAIEELNPDCPALAPRHRLMIVLAKN